MDVESRTIKQEASNDGPPCAEGGDDAGGCDVEGVGISSSNSSSHHEHELQDEAMQSHTKTIYSLNMNVCRLCLAEGHGQLQPIFYAQDTPDEILQQKILELTTVEITYANDFPTGVCIDCLAKLDEYSLFRRQCIDNNEILKLKYYELKAVADGYCKQEEDEADALREHHNNNSSSSRVSSTSKLPAVKKEVEGNYVEVESTTAEDAQHREMRGRKVVAAGDDSEAMEATACPEEQQGPSPFVPFIEEGAESEIIIGDGNDDEDQPPVAGGGRQRTVAPGTKIQYLCEDGTVAEYVTSGAIVRRESGAEMISEPGDGIYYTVGGDTYAIPATMEGYVNAANFVPPEFENQTEIECTTVEEHLPEEYVELEPQQQHQPTGGTLSTVSTVSATVVTSRGLHDRPFVCKHCKTSFKYEHNYDRHMKNHAKVLYRCSKCSKTFVKMRKCQQHFVKAHSSQRYECDICFRTYSLPTRLENHVIEMHSVNGVYSCDRCQGEMFSSYLDFKAHRMRYHPRTNDNTAGGGGGGDGGADTTMPPSIIKQTAYGDVVHMQQVLTVNQHTLDASVSPTPSSEGCDTEEVHQDRVSPVDNRKRQTNRASAGAVPVASTTTQRTRRANGGTTITATRSGRANESAASRREKSASVPLHVQQQEVILIDDDEQQQQQLVGHLLDDSPSAGSTLLVHTNGAANSSTNISRTSSSAAVHRELLQQIEESEAKASGPKMYPCKSCRKTFVHLNNLKAHIYAEHDNDKPFKCKQCPISFKTKEILVMHMLLHAQNNGTT